MTLHLLLLFLATTSPWTVLARVEETVEEKCTTRDCQYLYENFVILLPNSTSPCENIHAYVCDRPNDDRRLTNNGHEVKKYVKEQYKLLINDVTNALYTDSSNYGNEFLRWERRLYQQCMRLGSESEDPQIETTIERVWWHAKTSQRWQNVDEEMFTEGFGRAFFDVTVVQSFENVEKNIIMITPPTLSSLMDAYTMLKNILEIRSADDYDPKSNSHWISVLIDTIDIHRMKKIVNFFSSLFKSASLYLHSFPKDYEDNQNFKLTLREWTHEFNRHRSDEDKTYIDWDKIIRDTFKKAGIHVQSDEPIIVKNHPYFNELFQLLSTTDNEITAFAILMKVVADNLRYIDWRTAQSAKPIDRKSFCLCETKLYGISHEVLQAFKNGRHEVYNHEQSIEILINIKNSLKHEITNTNSLTYKEGAYLINELESITNPFLNIRSKNTTLAFYENIEYSQSYLKNIMNYRRNLKLKGLSSLRQHPELSTKYPPFSLVDLTDPANRFTINMMFTGGKFNSPFVPKQVYYGSYGTRMASILYALMNENKYHDASYIYLNKSAVYEYFNYDFEKISTVIVDPEADLSPNPEYKISKMQCFLPSKPVTEKTRDLESMVSDAYGLRIAYDAMERSERNTNYIRSSTVLFPNRGLNKMSQFFFLSYVKSHCGTREMFTNAVVYNQDFAKDFRTCAKEYPQCNQGAFENYNKNIFLI